jgi:hypothetical protein
VHEAWPGKILDIQDEDAKQSDPTQHIDAGNPVLQPDRDIYDNRSSQFFVDMCRS